MTAQRVGARVRNGIGYLIRENREAWRTYIVNEKKTSTRKKCYATL